MKASLSNIRIYIVTVFITVIAVKVTSNIRNVFTFKRFDKISSHFGRDLDTLCSHVGFISSNERMQQRDGNNRQYCHCYK